MIYLKMIKNKSIRRKKKFSKFMSGLKSYFLNQVKFFMNVVQNINIKWFKKKDFGIVKSVNSK